MFASHFEGILLYGCVEGLHKVDNLTPLAVIDCLFCAQLSMHLDWSPYVHGTGAQSCMVSCWFALQGVESHCVLPVVQSLAL